MWLVSAHTLDTHGHCAPYTFLLYIIGNTALFLYTPISLLPENSLITDVQQVTGRNGQQWITCNSGRLTPRPQIRMGSTFIPLSKHSPNSGTIGPVMDHPNGLYHCLAGGSQMQYFSLYLQNSGKHFAIIMPNLVS